LDRSQPEIRSIVKISWQRVGLVAKLVKIGRRIHWIHMNLNQVQNQMVKGRVGYEDFGENRYLQDVVRVLS